MKLLYTGAVSLFDTTTHSGDILALLQALARRGHEVVTFTGAVFSHVAVNDLPVALRRLDFSPTGQERLFERRDTTGRHLILGRGGRKDERSALVDRLKALIATEDPDFILYSTDAPDAHSLLPALGAFSDRLILCEDTSVAIEGVQAARVDKIAFGTGPDDTRRDTSGALWLPHLLPRARFAATETKGTRITMVGASARDGFGVFLQLYQAVLMALPHANFLAVQRPGEIEQFERQHRVSMRDFRKLDLLVHPWFDFDFLETSLALVLFNPRGRETVRLALEAMNRGVAVLVSKSPDFEDLPGASDNLFPSPVPSFENTLQAPMTAIMPWALALSELMTDAEFRTIQRETMKGAAKRHSSDEAARQAEAWLTGRLARTDRAGR